MSNDQWGLKPIQSPRGNSLTDFFRPNEEGVCNLFHSDINFQIYQQGDVKVMHCTAGT